MDGSNFRSQPRVVLAGSEKKSVEAAPPPSAAAAPPPSGTIAPLLRADSARMTVTVIVRRKNQIDQESLGTESGRMSRDDFAEQHGPDPQAVALVNAFATEYGLTTEAAAGAGRRTIRLTGTQGQMEAAFGVTLTEALIQGQIYRVREGAILLPEQLIGYVVAVLGLDNRPQASPHFRLRRRVATGMFTPHVAGDGSFSPVKVGQLYGFPPGADATGETIALIELGGGFQQSDLVTYFNGLGLPVPNVTAISVQGAFNSPSDPDSADNQVALDIQVAAAVAPGANIAVYFAPNTDSGMLDAISQAIHDITHRPSVISISWGAGETHWTDQAKTALNSACQSAGALGITITAASGDHGSADSVEGGPDQVDFPASSPNVLACGGTKLMAAGGAIANEEVWNEGFGDATGGGFSAYFPMPDWQTAAAASAIAGSVRGRGVPDVAGNADSTTGYQILVDGQPVVIGGTSAVAPLWAGLIALANKQNGGWAGFVTPALYAAGANACRDITAGNNGSFSAGPGWDPCTGLGSPLGQNIVAVLEPITSPRN